MKMIQMIESIIELRLINAVRVPPLEQLYSNYHDRTLDPIETKWDILKWIMSFSEGEISTLRKVKKQYRLICATLCALVKVIKIELTKWPFQICVACIQSIFFYSIR